MKTIVAMYNDLEDARRAVVALVNTGISNDDISLVTRDVDGKYGESLKPGEPEDTMGAAAGGAAGGAVIGGLAGFVLGLGVLAIPGLGPVIAAGPVVAGLTGAAMGAVAGGLIGALVEWGIPEDEAHYYAEGVRRGNTMVAVRVADFEVDTVVDTLDAYNPINIERRAEFWRAEDNWTGYQADARPYTADEITDYRRRVSEWEAMYDEDFDDDDDFNPFEDYEEGFRTHYKRVYGASYGTYDRFRPAYQFGYDLAVDPRYRDSDWDTVALYARRDWAERSRSLWSEVEDAVHHAWEQVKDAVGVGSYEFGVDDADEYRR